jgi:hypothetical protein
VLYPTLSSISLPFLPLSSISFSSLISSSIYAKSVLVSFSNIFLLFNALRLGWLFQVSPSSPSRSSHDSRSCWGR